MGNRAQNNNEQVPQEVTAQQPAAEPQVVYVEKVVEKEAKKENIFKRTKRKVGDWCRKHPALTALGGGILGSGATAAIGVVGKNAIENRQARQYQQYQQTQAQYNDLDPNN